MNPLLEAKHLTKSFPGVVALRDVSFDLRPGEIHALCGENGAGKSTLIKTLSGIHPFGSYEGEILVDGRRAEFRSLRDAEAAGLAVIAATPIAGPLTFDPAEPNILVIKHVLYGVIATFLLLPGFLGVGDTRDEVSPHSWWAAILANPIVVYLGTISYGVFLWHLVLLRFIQNALGLQVFSGGFWIVWPLVVLACIAVASASWFILERPVLAWAHRRTPGESAQATQPLPGQRSPAAQ